MTDEEIVYKLYLMISKNGGNLHIAFNDIVDESNSKEFRNIFDSMFDVSEILRSSLKDRLAIKDEATDDLGVAKYPAISWKTFYVPSKNSKIISIGEVGYESHVIFNIDQSFARLSINGMVVFRSVTGMLFAVSQDMEVINEVNDGRLRTPA